MCATLFLVHLFQSFPHFVELYFERGKKWVITLFFSFGCNSVV